MVKIQKAWQTHCAGKAVGRGTHNISGGETNWYNPSGEFDNI